MTLFDEVWTLTTGPQWSWGQRAALSKQILRDHQRRGALLTFSASTLFVAQWAEIHGQDTAPDQPPAELLGLVEDPDPLQAAKDTWHSVAAGGTAIAIGVGDPTLLDRIADLAQRYQSDALFLWSAWSIWAINNIADADEEKAEGDWQFQAAMDRCESILRNLAQSIA